jgi:glycosyltransferase involved in cell wall biosynthesis
MRIGIDARELCGRATGVGRYLGGLLAVWGEDERARRHEFVLYAPDPLPLTIDSHRFATRTLPGPAGTWWEQVTLPAAAKTDHLDVFFAPAYTAPSFRTTPVVVAIHDLSFFAHPEWFSTREGARRRLLTRRSARAAQAVVTISQFTRRELIERLNVQPDRIHVIPPGTTNPVLNKERPPSADGVRTILYVGSIFNRRRLPDLVSAFGRVARAHPDTALEIVGDNRSYPREDLPRLIAREGLTERARWRQYVADEELAALYGSARAFAFLSEYEGLGLTPLEALAAGVPPVLLDTPVARESCGGAALYVERGDIAGTARALEQLLFDDGMRQELLAAAPHAIARYRWPEAARDTLDLLERSSAA